jgi:eukaryotic-like serine/threonine-protein kinase
VAGTQVQDWPETLGGRYRVIDEIGRGGMGVVYRVEHLETGQQHAAKVLSARLQHDASALKRFRREALAGVRIGGKHVVPIVDVDLAPELGDLPFLVMDVLEGRDLRQELAARGHLPTLEVVKLLSQLARVLDVAHERGVVHRDLKPENLFVARQPDGSQLLKVLDFGLAKLVQSSTMSTAAGVGLTATGEILGTPRYMAPEQAWGAADDVGPEADRWALGMIAFELVTGQAYFEGHAGAILGALRKGSLEAPSELVPGVAPAFDAWFRRGCALDKRDRFDSSREQVLALARALGVGAGGRPSMQPSGAARSPASKPGPPATAMAASHSAPVQPAPMPSSPMPLVPIASALAARPLATRAPRRRVGLWLALAFTAVVIGALAGAMLMLWSRG